MTRRARWRPPWPVQFVVLCAAMALAALSWTGALWWAGVR